MKISIDAPLYGSFYTHMDQAGKVSILRVVAYPISSCNHLLYLPNVAEILMP